MPLSFELKKVDSRTSARRARVVTAHGAFETPTFMPVGTFGAVRTLDHEELEKCGVQVILGNTYHLFLRPGAEPLRQADGYHRFIAWDKPILTDSGGFQIFSLPSQRRITEKGVTFQSYVDKSYKFISPENNIEFQEIIGSDIMMVLDICVPSTSPKQECIDAMERTHRWALRCLAAKKREDTSLFAIMQGAVFEDLRKESADFITQHPFDGFAIGGLAVGETDEERQHFTKFAASLLPQNKPRYLMGVGTPHDLIRGILAGVDMFDCIIPTNHARQGIAYTWLGKVQLRRQVFTNDDRPLDEQCECYVCKRYSRRYLYQLNKCKEMTGWKLIAYHNTWFYERLMDRCRKSIEEDTFYEFANWFLSSVDD